MTTPPTFQLSAEQRQRAEAAVIRGRAYLDTATYPLGLALVDHLWSHGPATAVTSALATFQNPDGGFGNGLEVDIASPASNPFATRLAMHVLLELRDEPPPHMLSDLQGWLVETQAEDGDWHFSDETRAGDLAPWFAGWTFPSLNPACCLLGLASRLGISTPQMQDRVAQLFHDKASLNEAQSGEFYTLLPYVEYFGGGARQDRNAYLETMSESITAAANSGMYADAPHFWEHVLGGGPELVKRIPQEMLATFADTLIGEQGLAGNWPTPYSLAWKPYISTQACVTLARLRDGI
jgi:hypothetical protein